MKEHCPTCLFKKEGFPENYDGSLYYCLLRLQEIGIEGAKDKNSWAHYNTHRDESYFTHPKFENPKECPYLLEYTIKYETN